MADHGRITEPEKAKKVCPACGGSGNISYFQGESRFLLTIEECPFCCGTGQEQSPEDKAVDPMD